jgi:L-alanine-DL-glutamate epimerase-like enolase superfamily enzyme
MLTGIELTPKGIQMMADYVAAIREVVGYDIPLSADHFGHIGINSCIRLGKALEKYNPAWLEDMLPWQYTALWKKITDEVDIPTLTGDIYLKEPFIVLARNHAVDILHSDIASTGGRMASPIFLVSRISTMASVHVAAASDGCLVLENHSVEIPWWND